MQWQLFRFEICQRHNEQELFLLFLLSNLESDESLIHTRRKGIVNELATLLKVLIQILCVGIHSLQPKVLHFLFFLEIYETTH